MDLKVDATERHPSAFRPARWIILSVVVCVLCSAPHVLAQREHVPVDHQVYQFLKTMEVRGLIRNYHYSMLPLSRKEVASFLLTLDSSRAKLTQAEREYLNDFLIEFQIELRRNDPAPNVWLNFDLPFGENILDAFAWKRKSLYEYHDGFASVFVDGLASADYRRRGGDSIQHVSLLSLGIRVRGTIDDRFAYMILATNGSLNAGDLALAMQDPRLRSNYKLADAEHKNFDFTEGYALYDNDWLTLEIGRESMQIGAGYLDRVILADHAPPLDFVKMAVRYKSLSYQFFHGSAVHFGYVDSLMQRPLDNIIPKYVAMHRLEFDLVNRVRIGFTETAVYGNQYVKLAYLNPFSFLKSVENSLENIDKSQMGFDAEIHVTDNLNTFAELYLNDFSLTTRGTGARNNIVGYHGGLFYAEPMGMRNVNVVFEYMKLDPYSYSSRTDWNEYTNRNIQIGANLPPNSDLVSLQVQWRPIRNLGIDGTVSYQRHGSSLYDSTGRLLVNGNVGGNVLDAERNALDPTWFLNGIVTSATTFAAKITYEPFKQWVFAFNGAFVRHATAGAVGSDMYFGINAAVDY